MIICQFTLSLAVLIATNADALGQDTVARSAVEDGQLSFNNACRTRPSGARQQHEALGRSRSAEERAKIIAFLEANGGS